jgi:hypothetical protein
LAFASAIVAGDGALADLDGAFVASAEATGVFFTLTLFDGDDFTVFDFVREADLDRDWTAGMVSLRKTRIMPLSHVIAVTQPALPGADWRLRACPRVTSRSPQVICPGDPGC